MELRQPASALAGYVRQPAHSMLHTACRPTYMCVVLQNTSSTCKEGILVSHTACSVVCVKELQNTTSTCQGRIHVLHTKCSLVYGKELQNTTSTCQGRIHVLHIECRLGYGKECRTQQAHVRDAYMYCTSRAAVYGKELQNTSTCAA